MSCVPALAYCVVRYLAYCAVLILAYCVVSILAYFVEKGSVFPLQFSLTTGANRFKSHFRPLTRHIRSVEFSQVAGSRIDGVFPLRRSANIRKASQYLDASPWCVGGPLIQGRTPARIRSRVSTRVAAEVSRSETVRWRTPTLAAIES